MWVPHVISAILAANSTGKMEAKIEQRSGVKMCALLGYSQAKTIRHVHQAFGNTAMSPTQVKMWWKRFKDNPDRGVKDSVHPGRAPLVRIQKKALILEAVWKEGRSTTRQIARDVGCSSSTVFSVLKGDKYAKIAPKFIPHLLLDGEKAERRRVAQLNLDHLRADPTLVERIVATDESWVFSYDPRSKVADLQWVPPGCARPQKCLRGRSNKKVMIILFFDAAGVIHMDFAEQGTSINTDKYLQIIRRFRESMRRKRPALRRDNSWILLQDNAPAHVSLGAADFFHKTRTELWPHPPYSPDLSPCDYWAFPKLKALLKGMRFQTIEDLKISAIRTMKNIPKEEYRQALGRLEHRYERCVQCDGGYFEGRRLRPN